ncbi:hypothetical protein FRX31_008778 [Thalictrum thalictroides]|uniref:Retrotransposon gag domain-containing protein n=1 Tax=Thalictrum thalictroides TaxID=46969 RepID=A0A7J6WYI8_THATH|nr:hypothetical protein FRX31_008778 [Thalictrum thalictroides]
MSEPTTPETLTSLTAKYKEQQKLIENLTAENIKLKASTDNGSNPTTSKDTNIQPPAYNNNNGAHTSADKDIIADLQATQQQLQKLYDKVDKAPAHKTNSAQKVALTTLDKLKNELLHEDLFIQEPAPHFIPPKFNTYNGSDDPVDHIMQFKTSLAMYPKYKDIYTCLFAASLRGNAMEWYHKHKQHSITSYEQLEKLFIT